MSFDIFFYNLDFATIPYSLIYGYKYEKTIATFYFLFLLALLYIVFFAVKSLRLDAAMPCLYIYFNTCTRIAHINFLKREIKCLSLVLNFLDSN